MSPKYFNDYASAEGGHYNFRGLFVRQGDLCARHPQLEPDGINNLTLRLCLTQHAFAKLFEQTLRMRQVTRDDYEFLVPQIEGASTSGVARMIGRPRQELGNVGEQIDVELHNAHQYFYSFCTFASSVLDRLAVEIRDLYNLRSIEEKRIDWGFLFNTDERANTSWWNELSNMHIRSVLNDSSNNFSQLRKYRNLLEHRTFVPIAPGLGGSEFDYLVDSSTRLTDFTKEQLTSLLLLCEKVYKAIETDNVVQS